MKNALKTLFTTFALLGSIPFLAQTSAEKPTSTISLSGSASKKVSPDLAIISFNLSAKDVLGNLALSKLNTQTQQTITKITGAGFSKEQLKISNYGLNEDWEYTGGKSRKAGYSARQTLTLTFKMDKEKLNKLFAAFSDQQTENTQINFSTGLSEELQDKTQKELIALAINDATEKAHLIANAASLKIKAIKSIAYNTDDEAPMPPVRNMKSMEAFAAKNDSSFSEINVEETELSEDVSIVFITEGL
ncbi:MAG: SIMPL domain-containing protein [Bacteroidetes bacterium]|nr:SIMPL domain-containing protein [Bacteroidota bacterium]